MFRFADNQIVDSLDVVPEDYHCFYVEADGKFKLANDNPIVAASVKNLTQLGVTLDKERSNLEAAKKRNVDLGPLSQWGATPEEIAAAVTEQITEAAKKGDGAATKWQEKLNQQKQDMAKAHAEEIAATKQSAEGIRKALNSHLVTGTAVSALAKHKGSEHLLMPIIRQKVQVSEDNGEFRVSVVDENGTERFGGTGSPMTIDELVGELKRDPLYSRGFESEAPKGTGTTPGAPARKYTPASGEDERSSTDKIKAGLAAKR